MKLPSWTKKINRKKVDALQNDIERVFKKSKYASKLSRLRDGARLIVIITVECGNTRLVYECSQTVNRPIVELNNGRNQKSNE